MNGRGFNSAPQNEELQWASISRSRNTATSMLAEVREARGSAQGSRNPSNVENRAPDPPRTGPCGVTLGRSVFDDLPSTNQNKRGGFDSFITKGPRQNDSSQAVGIAVPPSYRHNQGSVFSTGQSAGHHASTGSTNFGRQTKVTGSTASTSTSGHSLPNTGFATQSSNQSNSSEPRHFHPGYFPEGFTGEPVPAPCTFDANRDPITNKPLHHGLPRQGGFGFDAGPFPRQPFRSSSAREATAPSPQMNNGFSSAPAVSLFSLEFDAISGRRLDPITRLPIDDGAYSADQERLDRLEFLENAALNRVTRGPPRGRGGGRGGGFSRGGGFRGGQNRRRYDGNTHNYHREPRFMKREGTAPGEEGGMWTYLRETAEAEKAKEADSSTPKATGESSGKTPLPLSKKAPKPKIRPTPASAMKIAQLLRAHWKKNHLTEMVDRCLVENAEAFVRDCARSNKHLEEEGCHSISADTLAFPPTLHLRAEAQMHRPVIVDGCAVAFCFDNEFCSLWQGKTRTSAFHKKRVLPMKPLIQAALRFIINGHKVIIALPAFYEEPTIKGHHVCKVDDLEAFNILLGLGLLQFVEPQTDPVTDLHTAIKELCRKVHGCYFSHHDMRSAYRLEDETEEGLLVENEVDKQKIMIAEGNADERVMSISYCGPAKSAVVSIRYAIYAGTSVDRLKDQYYTIGPETIFYYTEKDGDEHDAAKKLQQQLVFGDQVKQILVLCQLCELPLRTIRYVQLFLLVAQMYAIHLTQIEEFLESCPVLEEPEPKEIVVDDLVVQLGDEGFVIEEPQKSVAVEPLVDFEVDPEEIAVTQLTFLPPLVPTSAPAAPPAEEVPVCLDDLMPPTDPFDISIDLDDTVLN